MSDKSERNWHLGLAAGNTAMGAVVGANALKGIRTSSKLGTAVGATWTGLSGGLALRELSQARKAHLRSKRTAFGVVAKVLVEEDGGYAIYSKKGKRLAKPQSKEAAKKRLRQIEYFKHRDQVAKSSQPAAVKTARLIMRLRAKGDLVRHSRRTSSIVSGNELADQIIAVGPRANVPRKSVVPNPVGQAREHLRGSVSLDKKTGHAELHRGLEDPKFKELPRTRKLYDERKKSVLRLQAKIQQEGDQRKALARGIAGTRKQADGSTKKLMEERPMAAPAHRSRHGIPPARPIGRPLGREVR